MARAVQRLTPAMVARGRHARRECRALTADVARRTAGSIGRPVFHRRPRAADGAGGGRCLNACCPLKSCGLGLSLLQRPERRPRSARTRSRPGAPNGPPSRPNSKWRGGNIRLRPDRGEAAEAERRRHILAFDRRDHRRAPWLQFRHRQAIRPKPQVDDRDRRGVPSRDVRRQSGRFPRPHAPHDCAAALPATRRCRTCAGSWASCAP